MPPAPAIGPRRAPWLGLALASAAIGLGLAADSALRSSATYDEVLYLKVAASWWRTGEQDAITRVGSPSLFWKVQQAVPLWCLDRAGFGRMIDEPERSQEALLPLVRLACLPIWLVALGLTAWWADMAYGPRAMAMASALFAFSPNLLAHAPLATMEMPVIACAAGMFALFWRFLKRGERWAFAGSAAVGGLAVSCKYTAILLPPILAAGWWAERRRGPGEVGAGGLRRIALGMALYGAILAGANLVLTGFSTLPLSPNAGVHRSVESRFSGRVGQVVSAILEAPVPRELAGFAAQARLQSQGGSSYLFGERRDRGWWYYYLAALAVKAPPALWLLILARTVLAGRRWRTEDRTLPLMVALFLAITAAGSTRNFGIRYLLPMAPATIVWLSALAEAGGRWGWVVLAGLLGQGGAVAAIHPNELAYFPAWVGGPRGGRSLLADSNLDWGQGLKGLARLQGAHPELRGLTLYYFGDTDPSNYGVAGRSIVIDASAFHPDLPARLAADTPYLAVSASLQYGPWGPAGYFRSLEGVEPAFLLDDATIAIYRTDEVPGLRR